MRFPKKFYWGASSSAHQVEGHNTNDWSVWENESCRALAAAAKRRNESRSTGHLSTPAGSSLQRQSEDERNYVSGIACDHYNRYSEDFDLAKTLKHNAHRFSIEWSRIEPAEGVFDASEIAHYRDVVRALRDRSIEPFVTLWHFTVPLWFRDKGGWKGKNAVQYFTRYVEYILENLKDEVSHWITLNEPMVYAKSSYLSGNFPPQENNPISFLRVVQKFIAAHREAYRAIKKIDPDAQVGLAQNVIYFAAEKSSLPKQMFKKCLDWSWNLLLLERVSECQDFIGVNYYFRRSVDCGPGKSESAVLSDMNWELYPAGISPALKLLGKFSKPIYVMENGLADLEDIHRTWYLTESLTRISEAIANGADVRGYFHWSLTDNFEWDKGFWPRFGLIEIDYETLERKVRKSALEYAEIIKNNGLKG